LAPALFVISNIDFLEFVWILVLEFCDFLKFVLEFQESIFLSAIFLHFK